MIYNMFDNIKKKINGKKKVVCNITIDASLKEDLEKFKYEHTIDSLSPMINEMLIDWLNINKKEVEEKEE